MYYKRKSIILILLLFVFKTGVGQQAKNVAILLFDGVQIIDYTGPYEVLGYGFDVVTVAPKHGTVTTNMRMKVIPDYSIENCPDPDIIIIPGGYGVNNAVNEPKLIEWIKKKTKSAQVVMSVCNGAFLLEKAGLPDGLEITTTAGYIDTLQSLVPSAKVVRNKRFIDNGKIITTAGLSSGIDGALHIVSKLLGPGWEPVFARWLEYNWSPDSDYAAASLADCNTSKIMRLFYFELDATPVNYAGDKEKWQCDLKVNYGNNSDSLFEKINKEIVKREKWKLENADDTKGISTWSFIGKDKMKWIGSVEVSATDQTNKYNVSINNTPLKI